MDECEVTFKDMQRIGFNLTGGGARGAYQAGVLLALSEFLEELKLTGTNNPIKIWSGSSAGAINSTFLAAHADDLRKGAEKLVDLWRNLTPDQVYQTGMLSISSNSARWIRDLTFGPLFKKKLAKHLLNTAPLLELFEKNLPFLQIDEQIANGIIDAVTCSTYCYNSSETITFLQGKEPFAWHRRRRRVENTTLTAQHILASCSIPLLFPPTAINNAYYGDGGFRNTAPLSPTVKLGAEKILLVGVKYRAPDNEIDGYPGKPDIASIAGSALNALFMDSMEMDWERLVHINEIVQAHGKGIKTERSEYNLVNCKMISPSQNISKIAETRTEDGLPSMIQFLLSGLGAGKQTADLASYILFEPKFTGALIDLGYLDTQSRKQELMTWLAE